MSVHKRGEKWRVRYLDAGQHKSRTFDLRADAQAFDQEVRRRRQRGSLDTLTAKPQTLDGYLTDTWAPVHATALAESSKALYAWAYDTHVSPAFGQMPLHHITPGLVARWQAGLVAAGHGHETIRKARNVLSGILSTAVAAELVDRNPVASVRAPAAPLRPEPVVLAPARVELVRAACEPRGAALLSVLAYAGLRPQEAYDLRWCDVREATLLVSAAKTRRRRTVRLLAPLAQDLREWRMQAGRPADDELVFGMTRSRFGVWRSGEWAHALKTVGSDYVVPYTLRHGFASLLLHEGRSVVYVARQLGHSTSQCMQTYVHVIEELEDAPHISAEDAIREARQTKVAQQLPRLGG
jgi:integrase